MTVSTRVLAVGHDAGRQGAPIVMLELIKWFRRNTELDIEVVLHTDGPLRTQFEELSQTTVLNPYLGSPRTTARVARRLASPEVLDRFLALRLRRHLQRRCFDVIWVNSVASWRALEAIGLPGVPRVLHVHELEYAIRQVGPPKGVLASMADHFIAASNAVRDNIVDHHGVEPGTVTVAYSSIPDRNPPTPDPTERRKRREVLGIGPDDLVVIGCGTGELRKGVDLMPALLARLRHNRDLSNTHIIWVGQISEGLQELLVMDVERLGCNGGLHFPGEVDDPRSFFSLADVFVLPSREEPLGLVCLEAAQCGLPTVCFGEAGGAPEFVRDDAGIVVPYLDLQALADAILLLGHDSDLRRRLGNCAREKVETDFMIDTQAPKILKILGRLAGSERLSTSPTDKGIAP